MTWLTEAGETLLVACGVAVDVMEEHLLSGLSSGQIDTLRQALRLIVKAG